MKITSVDIIALKPTEAGHVKPVVCRINTSEGIYGLGEIGTAIMTGADASFAYIRELAEMIIGMDPLENEVIWEKLYKGTMWAQGNGAIVFSAISAIDTALWDIKGRYFGVPVYKLLGGKQREKLRCYASHFEYGWNVSTFSPMATLAEYERTCETIMEDGYTAIKGNFLLGDPTGKRRGFFDMCGALDREVLRTAEARIETCRRVCGDDMDIILENNSVTDAAAAIQYGKVMEPYDILFFEEPCSPLNADMFQKIAEHVNIPLATGERSYTRYGFLPLLQNRSITVAQPDLGTCGGITEGKKIADMAYCYDVGIQAHVCCGPISIAAGLQFEAALPNFYIHEVHVSHTGPELRELGVYDYSPKNGYIEIPELPGLGQELTDYALKNAYIETVTNVRHGMFK